MDLEKCGRTGVWGELLPRVREAQGGHQTQAVLLAQEILREDAAGRGLLGPVACRAGLAGLGSLRPALARRLRPHLVLGPGACPSIGRAGLSPLSLSPTCPFLLAGQRDASRGCRSAPHSHLPGKNTAAHFRGVNTPAWLLASRRRDLAEQSWGTADLLQPVRAGSSIPLLSSETDLTHGSLPWSRRRCRPLSDLCLSDPIAFLLPLPTAAALPGSLLFLHRLTSLLPQGLCSRALVSASPGSLSSSPS